ncbi:hypothetical protein GGR26_003509 [Lewinella marina]|uniref:BioF2-like acetyltransferase domain-containing protein n=1 Tax=Neolewinella marina TaxID=438751 RepID=A0A2G0CC86_9BACT|nr:GNAT family N-acetyltransferase [Neolewinella marina]NJB87725.1 hypothetical protein [Neolewinella marina]PHK97598.1 hypothetical protein CGL56_14265 [Neolewinella marina]
MPTAFLPALCTATESGRSGVEVPGFPGWEVKRFTRPADFTGWPAGEMADPDFWMEPTTLSFLSAHPQGMTTGGLELRDRNSGRVLLLTVQVFRFQLRDNVADAAGSVVSRWNLRRRLLATCSAEVLSLGQLLASGNCGLAAPQSLPVADRVGLVLAVADMLAADYRAVLLKDLFPPDPSVERGLAAAGFYHLPADPVMELDLEPFADLDDYLHQLTSKYRVRYRRARGKLEGLNRHQLSPHEINRYADRLHELYRETTRGADFNVVALKHDYFRWLGETGVVHGYFCDAGRLVGFTTALPNGGRYQAHFLGLEEDYKHSHHLYHNMLFDLLSDALTGPFSVLDFGRTALEIKSSLGAVPRRSDTYLRLRPAALNRLVPRFVPAVYEPRDWQPRSPFRGDVG